MSQTVTAESIESEWKSAERGSVRKHALYLALQVLKSRGDRELSVLRMQASGKSDWAPRPATSPAAPSVIAVEALRILEIDI
jgi:hypothetical protein